MLLVQMNLKFVISVDSMKFSYWQAKAIISYIRESSSGWEHLTAQVLILKITSHFKKWILIDVSISKSFIYRWESLYIFFEFSRISMHKIKEWLNTIDNWINSWFLYFQRRNNSFNWSLVIKIHLSYQSISHRILLWLIYYLYC